jgi:3-hydroxyacyl-[acyl-carrier-protein] dehydratase
LPSIVRDRHRWVWRVKFVLIDQIVALAPRERIVARKALSLAEEYLADHFPKFPVLPGVLMLEAMVQASAWVVRDALDFAPALVLLADARNVTYKSFVAPGQVLTIESTCLDLQDDQSRFQARGHLGGREIVKARLTLRHLNLADHDAAMADTDARLRAQQRALFALLTGRRPDTVAADLTVGS